MPTFRRQSTKCAAAAIALLGVIICGGSRAEDAATAVLSPKDAGARYGQALGAVEICFGSKVTGKATALGNAYTGMAHDDFEAQSAKIFESWIKVKNCADPRDPNMCKIIMDKSCATAEAEIGAAGTAIPGLVEFVKH